MELDDLQKLIEVFNSSLVEELQYEKNDFKINMKKNDRTGLEFRPRDVTYDTALAASAPTAIWEAPTTTENSTSSITEKTYYEVVSPMIGTFYTASSPDAEAFVQVGDKVNPGTVLCILEAMKLFNEIEAEVTGTIKEVMVENGQLVEYGQVLYLIDMD
jgi:acetyl-CoA carboxylase biotin carboxyl carrier protein